MKNFFSFWRSLNFDLAFGPNFSQMRVIRNKKMVFSFFRPDSLVGNFSKIRLELELGIFQIRLELETF